MTAWALGSVTDPHAPVRTLEQVRDETRERFHKTPREHVNARWDLFCRLIDIEHEIAIRKRENVNA